MNIIFKMKKLKITKEVIMNLSNDELGVIKGGTDTATGSDVLCSKYNKCASDTCPPPTERTIDPTLSVVICCPQ